MKLIFCFRDFEFNGRQVSFPWNFQAYLQLEIYISDLCLDESGKEFILSFKFKVKSHEFYWRRIFKENDSNTKRLRHHKGG